MKKDILKNVLSAVVGATIVISSITSLCFAAETPNKESEALNGKTEAAKLEFTEHGGGKFIYCNNSETVRRHHLADVSNPNPTYIMSNKNMTADKYTLYFSHLNRTEKRKLELEDRETNPEKEIEDSENPVLEVGFDIEMDVKFTANKNTKIKFTALGFEAQQPKNYYYMSRLINYEDSWGCMTALASYFKMPIYEQGDVLKYEPIRFQPVTAELKEGETLWLSKYIPNYSVVSWMKPVHLLCDFEILSGECDIDIAALKSTGTLKDRTQIADNPSDGRYYYDRQYKGIADTLPQVEAKLEYTVDDSIKDGTYLPVKIENSYTDGEHTVNTWITHLNAYDASKYIKKSCVNSDLIGFTYYDKTKPNGYGTEMVADKKDIVWQFDTYHSDLRNYSPKQSMYSPQNFVPNYKLQVGKYSTNVSCNLANYCVKEHYNLKVENEGDKTRYFKYNLATTANALVNVIDKNGEYTTPYLTAKGYDENRANEAMATVELKPHSITEFTIEVFLPINYPGGFENQFQITSTPIKLDFPQDMKQSSVKDMSFTGKEFFKFEGGELYTSADKVEWTKREISDLTRTVFASNYNNFEILYTKLGNVMRYKDFVETPSYYSGELQYRNKIYILDENYNIIKTTLFDEYPSAISFAADELFVKSGTKIYSTADGDTYIERPELVGYELPKDNGNGLKILMKEKDVFAISEGKEILPIKTLDGYVPPRFVEQLGPVFYYVEGKTVYVSGNGYVFQKLADCVNKVEVLNVIGNEIVVNNDERFEIPQFEREINIELDGQLLQLDSKPIMINDRTLVPIRQIFEALGAKVDWDNSAQRATVTMEDKTIKFGLNSQIAIVNKTNVMMGAAAVEKNSRIMVPLRFLAENLGYRVDWIDKSNTVRLTNRCFDS